MLVPHKVERLLDLSNGTWASPAKVSGGSTVQIVGALLECRPTGVLTTEDYGIYIHSET